MNSHARARAQGHSKLPNAPLNDRPGAFAPVAATARDIACVRAGRPVFAGLSFTAPAGRLLAVTGPNGSGKTSLLRMLAGLIRPDAGELRVDGGDRPVVHLFGSLDGLKPALSLREVLAFWAKLYGGLATGEGVPRAAADVGLGHALDLPAGALSAGQRRRAGLARLILAPRPLWLLDEPTSALDSDGEDLLAGLMRRHLADGGTIVAATHLALPVAPHAVLDLTLQRLVAE